jgi:type I restriction enzyme, S subunit
VKYAKYPAYQSTDVDWLGVVPVNWQVKRLKNLLAQPITDGPHTTPTFVDDGVPFLSVDGIQDGELIFPECRFVSAEDYRSFALKAAPIRDDILLAKAASTGKVARVKVDFEFGIWSPLALIRAAPKSSDARFLEYALKSNYMQAQITVLSTYNTQSNISMEDIPKLVVAVPELPEQHSIADFLDSQTAKIDALVAKKRELIDKLKEKRAALISRTVTRGLPPEAARAAGLDPHPRLKPSGIDWLGDVPEHWDVERLKWAITFQRGHDLPSDEREEGDVPVVTSSGVSATHSEARARAPGIVTGRYGTIAVFHVIERDYWPLNTTLYSIDLRDNEPRFLYYMLENLSPLFLINAVKSAVPGVDQNDIHPVLTAVPPRSEQVVIAKYLDVETTMIDDLGSKVEEASERLQEYRTALITAVVTGKIDVRAAAANADSAVPESAA